MNVTGRPGPSQVPAEESHAGSTKSRGSEVETRVQSSASETLSTLSVSPSSEVRSHRVSVERAERLRSAMKPIQAEVFKIDLARSVHTRAIRMTKQAQAAVSPGRTHVFSRLRGSQNPVARVQATSYIPQTVVESSRPSFTDLEAAKTAIKTIAIQQFKLYSIPGAKPTGRGQDERAEALFLFFTNDLTDDVFKKSGLTLDNIGQAVQEAFETRIELLKELNKEKEVSVLQAMRAEMASLFAPPNLVGVPILINKEEVLSKLAVLETKLSLQTAPRPEEQRALQTLREAIKLIPSNYFPKDLLINHFAEHAPTTAPQAPRPGMFKRAINALLRRPTAHAGPPIPLDPTLLRFLETTPSYYSSTDVLAANDYAAGVKKIIDKLPQSSFGRAVDISFKLGVENSRELLAAEINALTGTNPYLLVKTEEMFESSKFEEVERPRGLTSAWIADGEPINGDDVTAYNNTRKEIAVLTFRGTSIPTALVDRLAEQEAKLRSAISPESVCRHALQDLELMAYDSHPGQYMVVSGDAYCFDFARHLAPSTCYVRTIGTGSETRVALRSTFLDFPSSRDPLSPGAIKHIMERDMSKVEAQLRLYNRVGTSEFFTEVSQTIQNLFKDAEVFGEAVKAGDYEGMQAICDKYGTTLDRADLSQTRKTLMKKLREIKATMQESCFRQIDPKALEAWKVRVSRMKEYVSSAQVPTLEGMRDHVFQELRPFFKVLERLDGAPCTNIGVNRRAGVTALTSLESIIASAESEGLASSEELALMRTNLAILQAQACTGEELTLTMDM